MKTIIKILFSLTFLLPSITFAQGDVKLEIIGNINPNDYATIRLSYPMKDIGGTKIVWLEDDKFSEEGIGLINHRVLLGDLGKPVKVTAIIGFYNSGGAYQQSIIVTPAVIDILWEAQTAVPPFYRGKAIPSHESAVKTMAVAYFGSTTPSTNILYSWKKDKTISIGEGLNKISSVLLGAWENKSIEVSVSARFGESTSKSSIKIPSYRPSIAAYEISPTQGIITQESLNNSPIRNTMELNVFAVPFGFANKERTSGKLLYEWTMDSKKVRSGEGSVYETLTLSRNGTTIKAGTVPISLLAQNTVNVMQYSNLKFNWSFTE